MKGADQCPRCASRKWAQTDQPVTDFYAGTIRVCGNCGTAWEPFEVADLQHADERLSCFKAPCGNCAFRKGSPEQRDPEGWAKLQGNLDKGHMFFCHKGVPIDPKSDDGFAYPDGGKVPSKLRLCRGYLNTLENRPWFAPYKEAVDAA